MTTVSEDTIVRNRILLDNRAFKKCFLRYVSQNASGKDSEVNQVLTDLSQLEVGLQKHQLIHDMNNREIQLYEEEKTRIEQEIGKGREEIVLLKARLMEVQRIRANKLEYDEVAQKINELPSRNRSIENALKLRTKIERLKADTQSTRIKRDLRRKQLLTIITAIHELQDTITEDHEEEEERAMEEKLNEEAPTPSVQEEEEEGVLMEDELSERRVEAMDLS
ncbi:uncharacterized protein SPPG_00361 [Spizellomyces punctatus DAOM BR117]|uniref:THO complex subunit 7 n=1 Tax=Spizellomyces punctatus (strain DAOM BR117) TaxID=645134 RepID=A0A0L0HUT0_SPIPD|nr:uncharacterized protein SPPG_00361 [Spizellomyces punctatus DAOM BR117]KND04645.1 hypothetical protein SPPG_00361 [Spizellomyces punctatus DAOM BR117]|eukprot:XP_016612684.1 hypothetical protein SPPG_00361 [Spizellomyces punctatus DAOM BR117]